LIPKPVRPFRAEELGGIVHGNNWIAIEKRNFRAIMVLPLIVFDEGGLPMVFHSESAALGHMEVPDVSAGVYSIFAADGEVIIPQVHEAFLLPSIKAIKHSTLRFAATGQRAPEELKRKLVKYWLLIDSQLNASNTSTDDLLRLIFLLEKQRRRARLAITIAVVGLALMYYRFGFKWLLAI
jgi:hypothetical protein